MTIRARHHPARPALRLPHPHPLGRAGLVLWRVFRTILTWALFLLLALAAARSVFLLGERVLYELTFPITVDSNIYWAVGRGILNGLLPYRDLFETKPPGIFVLSALSWWMDDMMRPASYFQAVVLAALPLPLVLTSWRASRGRPLMFRTLLLGTVTLGGLGLAQFASERSGEFQVESFGALFGILYASVLAWRPRNRFVDAFLLTAALFCALGFKEPFLFPCFAAALILCRDPRAFVYRFLTPLLLAIVAGMLVLLAWGALGPFFSVYLPEMLGFHIGAYGSPWQRALDVRTTFADLEGFAPGFGVFLAGMGGLALILRLLDRQRYRMIPWDLLLFGSATYATLFAVGAGGQFYNHHFVFLLPAAAALFLVFSTQSAETSRRRTATTLTGCACVAAIFMTFALPSFSTKGRFADRMFVEPNRRLAAQIDGILDACALPRYLFLGGNGNQPYGYTSHSPLGPLFFQLPEFVHPDRISMRAAFRMQLQQASFVVFNEHMTGDMDDEVRQYLATYFTSAPWPCASAFTKEPPARPEYRFLFRRR